MADDLVKHQLANALRSVREGILVKLDGLSEYDVRRPLTHTGTNLLGLVKHLATWDARYLGEVFERPFPEPLPRWDDRTRRGTDSWVTAQESRDEVIGRYRRVWAHTEGTIDALDLDAPGLVPWWSTPRVTLSAVLVHLLAEANRHAGHADILREQLDGRAGMDLEFPTTPEDQAFWAERRATIEAAARAASPSSG
jgi:hypothetical protein